MANDKIMVQFIKPYEKRFTGTDLEPYGPFDEGDIVRLPPANADVLESWGVVRKFGSDDG